MTSDNDVWKLMLMRKACPRTPCCELGSSHVGECRLPWSWRDYRWGDYRSPTWVQFLDLLVPVGLTLGVVFGWHLIF